MGTVGSFPARFLALFVIIPVFSNAESILRVEAESYLANPKIINQELDKLHCRKGHGGGYGGTVVLGPGTFSLDEPIYLPNNTSLVGHGRLKTKIVRANLPSGEPTIIVGGRSSCQNNQPHPAQDIEISGLEITAQMNSQGTAVEVNGGQDVRIRHNTVRNHLKGIVLDGGSRHSINGNQLIGQRQIGIQITASHSGISTSHYVEGNHFLDSGIGVSIECLETGFITNNVFKNTKTHSISIRRLPQSATVCGGSSIISGVSIIRNQFVAGLQSKNSQIKFLNGYSFPINFSIVDNFFSAEHKLIHAIHAEANGNSPNVRSLIVFRNSFIRHGKAPLKLGGALGFNISENVFDTFGSGAFGRSNPEFNAGIYLIGGRANCGGVTEAGIISNNLFKPRVAFRAAQGWAIYSACMSSTPNIKISENSIVDQSENQNFLTGADIGQAPSDLPSLADLQATFNRRAARPSESTLPDFSEVRSVLKCTDFLETANESNAATTINAALEIMGKKGGGCFA